MKLYSAHIILYIQLKSGRQRNFPVWENIVLFSAGSSDAAFAKAEAYGRREAEEDESLTWGNKPARWVFAGVRKVSPCHVSSARSLDGVEVACNEFEMKSVAGIAQLVSGEPVELLLCDHFADSAAPAKRQSSRIVKKLA